MANVPSNDPNVDAPAIVPAPVNSDHAPAQPVGLGDGFAPHWIKNNIPNNQNGWIEEDTEEEEEDLEKDPEEEPKDDDDDMEIDDEAKVIDPYMDAGSNNPPPSNFEDKETPPTSPIIPDADEPVKVNHSYEVELADGREAHVPFKKRTLVVKGDDCVSRLKVVSCMKVKKYVDHGSYLFVAHVVKKEPAERRLKDVPVIFKFPDMFPKDLPGLPPPRQVEFENWFLEPLLWRVRLID
nr:reverse transcriptase domain-containing protein [Tanacetum cinerariifolium]